MLKGSLAVIYHIDLIVERVFFFEEILFNPGRSTRGWVDVVSSSVLRVL